jgi:flagellar protein FlgJ
MNALAANMPPVATLGADPQALTAQMKSGDAQSVEKAATGFESMFASLVLKEMRQTLDSGSLFAGDTGDVYGGLFDLYLGQHVAQSGGFGIAAAIRRQFEAAQSHVAKPSGGNHGI